MRIGLIGLIVVGMITPVIAQDIYEPDDSAATAKVKREGRTPRQKLETEPGEAAKRQV